MKSTPPIVWFDTEHELELLADLYEDWRQDIYPKWEETYEYLEASEDWTDLQEKWLWGK